jgi:hypothetical protein
LWSSVGLMSRKESTPPQSTQIPKLKSLISEIVQELPPFEYTKLSNSEIDYYGASNNIARGLGLKGIPYTRASWHHGWYRYPLIQKLIVHEDCVAFCNVREVPNLVATKDMEIFLRKNGFPHAVAVGDPFLYTQDPNVKRIPGSLLIIPNHSLKETNYHYTQSIKNLLPDNLSNLRKKFSMIVACIGGFCALRGNYTKGYEDFGVPWVTGAWLNDEYALQRIRNLFSQFEYVATDSIGSHIPYAGYCGCKLIYYGKGKNQTKKEFAETPFYQNHPHLIDIVIHEQKLETIQKRFPILFNKHSQTEEFKEWSLEVLGTQNQLPPQDIAELIGWKIRQKKTHSWEYIPGENPGLLVNA